MIFTNFSVDHTEGCSSSTNPNQLDQLNQMSYLMLQAHIGTEEVLYFKEYEGVKNTGVMVSIIFV